MTVAHASPSVGGGQERGQVSCGGAREAQPCPRACPEPVCGSGLHQLTWDCSQAKCSHQGWAQPPGKGSPPGHEGAADLDGFREPRRARRSSGPEGLACPEATGELLKAEPCGAAGHGAALLAVAVSGGMPGKGQALLFL